MYKIPVYQPSLNGNEKKYVNECLGKINILEINASKSEIIGKYMDFDIILNNGKFGKYIVYDVGAPYDFVDAGFEREDAVKVKNKLRNKGFISLGVGQFAKEM